MRVVGLTGGIASGKSTFAEALRARGVPVVDADALARAAVAPGSPALAEIARAFGAGRARAGRHARPQAAWRRSSSPTRRRARRLEAITHPAVRRAMAEETARLAAAGHDLAFYDTPLLYEVGLDRTLDCRRGGLGPAARCSARGSPPATASPRRRPRRASPRSSPSTRRPRAPTSSSRTWARPPSSAPKADRLLADLRAGLGRKLPNARARALLTAAMAVAERVHFVTGYPGFIGKRLVRRLAEELRGGPDRARPPRPAEERAARRAPTSPSAAPTRAEVVEGDVEQMHLGLSGAEFKALARDVTDVWHLAARTLLGADARRAAARERRGDAQRPRARRAPRGGCAA